MVVVADYQHRFLLPARLRLESLTSACSEKIQGSSLKLARLGASNFDTNLRQSRQRSADFSDLPSKAWRLRTHLNLENLQRRRCYETAGDQLTHSDTPELPAKMKCMYHRMRATMQLLTIS